MPHEYTGTLAVADQLHNLTVSRKIDPNLVREIVERIVATAKPEKVILFGSAARGELGPDSDLDLLVIKAGVVHRRRLAQQIHRKLFGIPVPVDIIVATPEDVRELGHQPGSVVMAALDEGVEVYAS